MSKLWWLLLAPLFSTPAQAAFEFQDIACETTTTSGTGTVNLGGALAGGYLSFAGAGISNGATVPYNIKNATQLETGIGTFTDATPDTLSRTAYKSTSGSGVALTLSGTSTVCIGPGTQVFTAGVTILSVGTVTAATGITSTTGNIVATAGDVTATAGDVSAGDDLIAADDLQLPVAGEINFGAGDVLITSAANDLSFTGVTGDYSFDDTVGVTGSVTASVDVTATAGDVTSGDDLISGDDVLLSDAGVINWNSGDCTLTEGTNTLTVAGTCTLTTEVVVPDGDATRDLGSTAASWAAAHLTTIELGADSDTTIARSGAGAATLEGSAVKTAGTETLWIPAGAMKSRVTSGAATGTYDSGAADNTIATLDFDGAAQEHAQFQVAMPKSWNEGTITYQALWTCTGCTAAETVAWELSCGAVSNDDALNITMGTIQDSDDAVLAAGDQHTSPLSAAVTCAGTPAEGDYVIFNIRRDITTDNMNEDAILLGVKVYYTSNAPNDG